MTSTDTRATAAPSFAEALRVWAKIGVLSFGGPAGQIALMHRMLVDERRWIDERLYLNALNFCMLLPGPEAMQLATYVGWRLHGTKGGLVAGLLFVVPGALVIMTLAAIYFAFGKAPLVEALFFGIKAAVLVIVIEALIRVARRALKTRADWGIAAASFVAIFFLALPFPLIIAGAAAAGVLLRSDVKKSEPAPARAEPVAIAVTLRTVALWLAIWIVPLVAIAVLFGHDHVLSSLGLFFSKLAVVTFGGAYAVLAYMAQSVVAHYGWLTAGEMLDGLGLAETTPGPLILVTEFVGFIAAARHGGQPALVFGMLGALVTLWATFAPCFLWIFAGAPYIERIAANPKLSAALTGVTAAVVGVILNLSLWFALHVLFGTVREQWWGFVHLWVPDITTLDVLAAALALFAGVLLLRFHAGIFTTLGVCAVLGLAGRTLL